MPRAEDLLLEHHELHAALRALEVLLAAAPGDERPWVADLAGELRELGPRLLAHFASEERSGLFEEIGQRNPEDLRAARRLREEHHELANLLARLHGEALAWPVPGGARAFAARVRAFLRALKAHEARENDVLLRSLDGSVAAAD